MRHDSYNSTAFKILFLLQQLRLQPLSYTDIQALFVAHPNIQKAPSQDSIGIYLNTLREIGCKISRPTSRNGYRYALQQHPFQIDLSLANHHNLAETLIALRQAVDGQVDYWDYFYFNRWLGTIIQQLVEPGDTSTESQNDSEDSLSGQTQGSLKQTILGDFSDTDWDTTEAQLLFIEAAIRDKALLCFQYDRPGLRPEERQRTRYILPRTILARRNAFYVVGYGQDYDASQMLRLERIRDLAREDRQPDIRNTLLQKCQAPQHILAQLLHTSPSQYTPLNPNLDAGGLLQNDASESIFEDPHHPEHTLVLFHTDNEFMVTRHLLANGQPFRILAPTSAQHALENELQAMANLYDDIGQNMAPPALTTGT